MNVMDFCCSLFLSLCSNKAVDSESACVLKVQMHYGEVTRCQYSHDGSRVVSCATDDTVKVRERRV